MSPLSALDNLELEECRDAGDPQSEEHCQAAPVYYSDALDLAIANDLRDAPRPKGARGRAVGVRPWSQIVGITWHQTATKDFPPGHHGLLNVPAHAMLHRDGSVSLLHHPTAYVYHGHALNHGTIGVEIACRAAGVEGERLTFWRSRKEIQGWHEAMEAHGAIWPERVGYDKTHPGKWHPPQTYSDLVAEATDAQLAAIPLIMGYYVRLVGANAYPDIPGQHSARGQWAHRQGHESRTSDPGSRIFKAVDRARKELGLPDVHKLHLGSGRPVDVTWLDP
jgi:hypothetical protein